VADNRGVSSAEVAGQAPHISQCDGYCIPGLVSIIVPVLELARPWTLRHKWHRARSLPDFLGNLARHVHCLHEVIVICNGGDDLRRYVSQDKRIGKFCINSVNVGVSRSWNIGAMLSEGEFLCFANDDVEIGPRCIERLKEELEAHPDVGEVGPAGGQFPDGKPGHRVGKEEPEDAEEISGFCFMTTRSVFDAAGGFDVRYTPAGFEEIDYSFRVRAQGLRCRVLPKLNIVHHNQGGVSATEAPIRYFGRSVLRRDLHQRNHALFCSKWIQK
jgi:GT2 family glycosyltransferase